MSNWTYIRLITTTLNYQNHISEYCIGSAIIYFLFRFLTFPWYSIFLCPCSVYFHITDVRLKYYWTCSCSLVCNSSVCLCGRVMLASAELHWDSSGFATALPLLLQALALSRQHNLQSLTSETLLHLAFTQVHKHKRLIDMRINWSVFKYTCVFVVSKIWRKSAIVH